MNVKKQFKNHMRPILNVDDCYDRVSRRIDFNEEKENRHMKKILIPIGLTTIAACAIAVISFNLLPREPELKAIVSVDVNPSIDLVVDKNNTVISVSGANEEGKMIIAEEDIVGKDVEQAVEIIINTESETGYLVKGNVQTGENTVTITVSADTKAIQEALENTITNTVNQACSQLNIVASTVINEAQKYTREALEKKALLCDPTLTEEDVEKMSYEQLLAVINLHYLETAEIYSQELENLYLEAKSSEISFAESEFVQEAIDKTNIIYQFLLEQYDNLCETLKTKSDELETLRYNTLVSEDSDYQKKLQEVNNAKADVISLRNELAASETPDKQVEILLETKEALLNLLNDALEGLGNAANASIDLLKNTVNAALEALLNLRESFPSEIKTTLQEKAKEAETFINEKKDAFFEKFEEKYKDDIVRMKEDVLARKQALKDKIAQQ